MSVIPTQRSHTGVLHIEWWWGVWGWETTGRRPHEGSWWSHLPCYSLLCASQRHSGLQRWGSSRGHTEDTKNDSNNLFTWSDVAQSTTFFFNKRWIFFVIYGAENNTHLQITPWTPWTVKRHHISVPPDSHCVCILFCIHQVAHTPTRLHLAGSLRMICNGTSQITYGTTAFAMIWSNI